MYHEKVERVFLHLYHSVIGCLYLQIRIVFALVFFCRKNAAKRAKILSGLTLTKMEFIRFWLTRRLLYVFIFYCNLFHFVSFSNFFFLRFYKYSSQNYLWAHNTKSILDHIQYSEHVVLNAAQRDTENQKLCVQQFIEFYQILYSLRRPLRWMKSYLRNRLAGRFCGCRHKRTYLW